MQDMFGEGEKIILTDNEFGEIGEFVVLDYITETEKKFVLIIEAKRTSTDQAMKQIMLSLKDARDNGEGKVYGFVTTGDHWRMFCYDRSEFLQTEEFMVG